MIHAVSSIGRGGDDFNDLVSPFKPHFDLYPKAYVARRTLFPLIDHLDGDLTKVRACLIA